MPKSQNKKIVKGMIVRDKCFNQLCEVFIVAPHEDGEVGVVTKNKVGIFKKKHFWDNFVEVKS